VRGKAKETGGRGHGAERQPEVGDWRRVVAATNGPKDEETRSLLPEVIHNEPVRIGKS
jgi:hypothetical protein